MRRDGRVSQYRILDEDTYLRGGFTQTSDLLPTWNRARFDGRYRQMAGMVAFCDTRETRD